MPSHFEAVDEPVGMDWSLQRRDFGRLAGWWQRAVSGARNAQPLAALFELFRRHYARRQLLPCHAGRHENGREHVWLVDVAWGCWAFLHRALCRPALP